MNIQRESRIAMIQIEWIVDEMAERAKNANRSQMIDALESINAQASFEIRSFTQKHRLRIFTEFNGR